MGVIGTLRRPVAIGGGVLQRTGVLQPKCTPIIMACSYSNGGMLLPPKSVSLPSQRRGIVDAGLTLRRPLVAGMAIDDTSWLTCLGGFTNNRMCI